METPDGLFRFEIIERHLYWEDPVGKEILDETVLGVFHLSDNGISWVLDSFITVETLAAAHCPEYEGLIEDVKLGVEAELGLGPSPDVDPAKVREVIRSLLKRADLARRLKAVNDGDILSNEVLMFDDVEGATNYYLTAGVYPEAADDFVQHFGYFWRWDTYGKTRSGDRGLVARIEGEDTFDMFIRRGTFEADPGGEYPADPLKRPGSDLVADEGEIRFNSCKDLAARRDRPGDAHFTAFGTVVHESGHAFGLGHSGGKRKHYEGTDLPGSVMNALSEPDCSPHPFDIMAIYALYQTR